MSILFHEILGADTMPVVQLREAIPAVAMTHVVRHDAQKAYELVLSVASCGTVHSLVRPEAPDADASPALFHSMGGTCGIFVGDAPAGNGGSMVQDLRGNRLVGMCINGKMRLFLCQLARVKDALTFGTWPESKEEAMFDAMVAGTTAVKACAFHTVDNNLFAYATVANGQVKMHIRHFMASAFQELHMPMDDVFSICFAHTHLLVLYVYEGATILKSFPLKADALVPSAQPIDMEAYLANLPSSNREVINKYVNTMQAQMKARWQQLKSGISCEFVQDMAQRSLALGTDTPVAVHTIKLHMSFSNAFAPFVAILFTNRLELRRVETMATVATVPLTKASAFASTQVVNRHHVVVVGSQDGMLHVLDIEDKSDGQHALTLKKTKCLRKLGVTKIGAVGISMKEPAFVSDVAHAARHHVVTVSFVDGLFAVYSLPALLE